MAIINTKTFEILDGDGRKKSKDEYFECDELIAPVVALLNKKGYVTKNSCSAHAFPEIYRSKIRPIDEEKDLSPFQFMEKHNLYSVSAPDKDGYMDVSQIEWGAEQAYIDFASYVKLPSVPENWSYDNRIIRCFITDTAKDEHSYEEFSENPYLFYEQRLKVMKDLYIWAEALPEYESIITEDNKKERLFETVTAPAIIDSFLNEYADVFEASKELRDDFLEYANDELFYITATDISTEHVQYPDFVYVPLDEKESYFRNRLQRLMDGVPDRIELSCDKWSETFDDTDEMYDYMVKKILQPDFSKMNSAEKDEYEKKYEDFMDLLQTSTLHEKFFCQVLNEKGGDFFSEKDFSVKIV